MTKTCSKCGQTKPADQFRPNRNTCLECKRVTDRERWRQKHGSTELVVGTSIDWQAKPLAAPPCVDFDRFDEGAGVAVRDGEDMVGLSYHALARLYGTTYNAIVQALARAGVEMTPHLVRLPGPSGRPVAYVLGPGIYLVGMRLESPQASEVRLWLAKRGWELTTKGVTTAMGPLTAARTGDQVTALGHALLEIGERLNRGEDVDRDHEQRIGTLEGFAAEVKPLIRQRRPTPLAEDKRWILSKYPEYGCTTCGSRDTSLMCVGHVKAHSDGGANDLTNFMPQCRPCNNNKTAADKALRGAKDESYRVDPREPWMREAAAQIVALRAERQRIARERREQREREAARQNQVKASQTSFYDAWASRN